MLALLSASFQNLTLCTHTKYSISTNFYKQQKKLAGTITRTIIFCVWIIDKNATNYE